MKIQFESSNSSFLFKTQYPIVPIRHIKIYTRAADENHLGRYILIYWDPSVSDVCVKSMLDSGIEPIKMPEWENFAGVYGVVYRFHERAGDYLRYDLQYPVHFTTSMLASFRSCDSFDPVDYNDPDFGGFKALSYERFEHEANEIVMRDGEELIEKYGCSRMQEILYTFCKILNIPRGQDIDYYDAIFNVEGFLLREAEQEHPPFTLHYTREAEMDRSGKVKMVFYEDMDMDDESRLIVIKRAFLMTLHLLHLFAERCTAYMEDEAVGIQTMSLITQYVYGSDNVYEALHTFSKLLEHLLRNAHPCPAWQVEIPGEQEVYAILELIKNIKNASIKSKDDLLYILRGKGNKSMKNDAQQEQQRDHLTDLRNMMRGKKLSAAAKKKIEAEFIRMSRIGPTNLEYDSLYNWTEKVLSLPWGKLKASKSKVTTTTLSKRLHSTHYGMDDVKSLIVDHLGIQLRRARLKIDMEDVSPVLCLVGPPGVGKSTIAKSIASALNRPFERISLGGLKDVHDLKGHRKTYLGAVHGAIAERMISAQYDDPVILLDEIDKISNLNKSVCGTLLDILDPAQNKGFRDAFMDLEYDLSKVLFIATANSDDMDPALINRMKLVRVEGYSLDEKLNIAKNWLIPKQMHDNAVTKDNFTMNDDIILHLISDYTFEAGVRELQRCISTILIKIALQLEPKKNADNTYVITKDIVKDYLGSAPYSHMHRRYRGEPAVGVTNGLAYMSVGGTVLSVQSTTVKGKGHLHITGNLGKVMHETAKVAHAVALNYISVHKLKAEADKQDIYVHYPSAIRKDGPSAGIATCLVLISSLTGKKLRRDFAVTGEIELTGDALRIGGLKEKVQAAITAQLSSVFLPRENQSDVADLPKSMTENIEIKYMDSIEDIAQYALDVS